MTRLAILRSIFKNSPKHQSYPRTSCLSEKTVLRTGHKIAGKIQRSTQVGCTIMRTKLRRERKNVVVWFRLKSQRGTGEQPGKIRPWNAVNVCTRIRMRSIPGYFGLRTRARKWSDGKSDKDGRNPVRSGAPARKLDLPIVRNARRP